jgi:hypothetical protein
VAQFVALITNPKTNGTVFIPGSKEAASAEGAASCLTLDELFDIDMQHPNMAIAYLQSWVVPGATLHSSAFRDGMVLETMYRPGAGQPYLKLTLGKQVT